MCTLFAGYEVRSLVVRGEDRQDIALGLHRSVECRAVSMLNRVTGSRPFLFDGGVARKPRMRHLMEEALDTGLLLPENPQMVGALGAAILGKENR